MDYIYDSQTFIDLYELLELEIDVSHEDIKKRYLKLSKIHHPDHGGNNEMFQEITKAYEILYDKETRKEYDLYYLKKNMDEFKNDDFFKLKNDYTDFIKSTDKPITEQQKTDLFNNFFSNNIISDSLDEKELTQRINDIQLERNTMEIEVDNKLHDIIKENDGYTINDVYEYMKLKENINNKELVVNSISTLDTLPVNNINYYSLTDDNLESNLYSSIFTNENMLSQDNINNINMTDFSDWKHKKSNDKRLSSNEIDNFINRRKQEEEEIINNVKINLERSTKDVKNYINNKYINEDIEEDKNDTKSKNVISNVRKRELKEKTS